VSGGVVYRAKRRGVIYAALASPFLAATVAATLVCLFLALTALFTGDLIDLIESVGWRQLPGYVMAFSLLAVIYANLFIYVTASPLMAIAWLTAHRLGWRGPRAMALVMGVGGLIYGAGLFGVFGWREFSASPVVGVLWIAAGGGVGLLSGMVTGAFISTMGYQRALPTRPGAPPREPDPAQRAASWPACPPAP
jgi:MFS family permease